MKNSKSKKKINYSNEEISNCSIDYFGSDTNELFHYGKFYVSLYREVFSHYISRLSINFENTLKEIMEKFSLNEDDILMKFIKSDYNFPKEINYSDTEYFIKIRERFFVALSGSGIAVIHGNTIPKEDIHTILEIAEKNKAADIPEPRKFYMVTNTGGDLELADFEVKKMLVDINDNYNNDFKPIHKIITATLKDNSINGMILLHGLPGSGKTTYLRSLISNVDVRFIYLPAHMLSTISTPGFMPFLMKYKNSVLIIEDCEEIILSRENSNYNNPAIINLLNLGDGLLADALSIKVICTFNTDIKNVDKALLRKGRLISRYEFKELEVVKAKSLAKKIGCKNTITKSTLLSEIYNWNKDNNVVTNQRKKIGFKE